MFSDTWPPCLKFTLKVVTLLVGLSAAVTGARAAKLWLDASKVPIPRVILLLASSADVQAQSAISDLGGIRVALEVSAGLNVRAARWTAVAAFLTGVAVVLGAV